MQKSIIPGQTETHAQHKPVPASVASALLAAASTHADNIALILGVLAAGMYPNVARANPFVRHTWLSHK